MVVKRFEGRLGRFEIELTLSTLTKGLYLGSGIYIHKKGLHIQIGLLKLLLELAFSSV